MQLVHTVLPVAEKDIITLIYRGVCYEVSKNQIYRSDRTSEARAAISG